MPYNGWSGLTRGVIEYHMTSKTRAQYMRATKGDKTLSVIWDGGYMVRMAELGKGIVEQDTYSTWREARSRFLYLRKVN